MGVTRKLVLEIDMATSSLLEHIKSVIVQRNIRMIGSSGVYQPQSATYKAIIQQAIAEMANRINAEEVSQDVI